MMGAAGSPEQSVQTHFHTRYKDPEGNSVRDAGRQSMNAYGNLTLWRLTTNIGVVPKANL